MIKIVNRTVEAGSGSRARAEKSWHALLNRRDIGFFQVTERDALWTSSRKRAEELRGRFDRLAVLGIGGSSLGGRALAESLGLERVEFFENVDGKDFWQRLEAISDAGKTHWVLISKSGGTLETLAQANLVSQFLEGKGLSLAKSSTVVSENRDNPLTEWAKAHNVPILDLPVDIGGRFSILTPVGLFPAAFLGQSVDEMRQGAAWALTQKDLVVELTAQSLDSFSREEFITLFWAYSNQLRNFGFWIQQLWAESLAKRTDRKGKPAPEVSTPVPLIGANDQHSILQQVAEGRRDKFVWFLKVREAETWGPAIQKNHFRGQEHLIGKKLGDLLDAEQKATADALSRDKVQSLTLELEKLDAATLGAAFMLFELVVGTLGEALDINAFDQPGVELGKRLAKEILTSKR